MKTDEEWMAVAIQEANKARENGEVPVGAIVVKNNELISSGYNTRESDQDPTGHAEIMALRRAAKALGSWRLLDSTLYVTLEPCPMCAGAIVHSRISDLVYGASDPKTGAVDSLYEITTDSRLNHQVTVKSGVLESECSNLLKTFFKEIRNR